MALSEASSKQIIKEEMEAVFGPADDGVISDKAHTAIANAINRILTENAVVTASGTSSGGHTVTVSGSIS